MKTLIFLLINFCLAATLFAQKKQNLYKFKKDGTEAKKGDSVDFVRVIREPDPGAKNFEILEFYPDQSKKLEGHVSAFEPRLVYEGIITSYYKNGNKSKVESYENGTRQGLSNYYYLNGQLEKSLDYAT